MRTNALHILTSRVSVPAYCFHYHLSLRAGSSGGALRKRESERVCLVKETAEKNVSLGQQAVWMGQAVLQGEGYRMQTGPREPV